jgi:hypothetical protein
MISPNARLVNLTQKNLNLAERVAAPSWYSKCQTDVHFVYLIFPVFYK